MSARVVKKLARRHRKASLPPQIERSNSSLDRGEKPIPSLVFDPAIKLHLPNLPKGEDFLR